VPRAARRYLRAATRARARTPLRFTRRTRREFQETRVIALEAAPKPLLDVGAPQPGAADALIHDRPSPASKIEISEKAKRRKSEKAERRKGERARRRKGESVNLRPPRNEFRVWQVPNNALQRGWLLSGWGFHAQPNRRVVAASAHGFMAHRVTVQPLTKKRKISWRLLKIENQFLPPFPFPPRCAGGRETFFLWGFAGGLRPPAKPLIFPPPPQRRWGGGRGWGKSYSSQRFIHRRLAPWRQAEQLPHIFIFGWCTPAHGVSLNSPGALRYSPCAICLTCPMPAVVIAPTPA